jgi:hypothetical protein
MQESKEEEEEGHLRKPHIMPSKFMQTQPLQQPSQVDWYSFKSLHLNWVAQTSIKFKSQLNIKCKLMPCTFQVILRVN